MLIYGGKNDNAFTYHENDRFKGINEPRIKEYLYNEVTSSVLDDIMLLNLATREWSAVAQRGWRPEPRWASAVAYNE